MTKQESIVNLSSIFNRGSSKDPDTLFFKDKKHDELLDLLQDYIQHSSFLIGNPRVFKTQSLNDHGVDLIVEFPNKSKIGLQIKSHFDVTEKDFAVKVKAQMADSQFHGLDKWYLFICSPINDGTTDYSFKISHLINEFSGYKTTYHVIYSPQQCHNILNSQVMTPQEFQAIKNQFFLEPVDWRDIIKMLTDGKPDSSYLNRVHGATEYKAQTAQLYLDYMGLGEEEKDDVLKYLNDLQDLLKKLTKQTREFLYVVISRYVRKDRLRQLILTPCQDVENHLNLSMDKIKNEVAILDNHRIAFFDEEDGIWYIAIRRTNPDYNILEDIKDFCDKTSKPLEQIIVNLDFTQFDQ